MQLTLLVFTHGIPSTPLSRAAFIEHVPALPALGFHIIVIEAHNDTLCYIELVPGVSIQMRLLCLGSLALNQSLYELNHWWKVRVICLGPVLLTFCHRIVLDAG